MYLSVGEDKIVLGEYNTKIHKFIEATVCHINGESRFINLYSNGKFIATIKAENGVCISFSRYKSLRFNGKDVDLEFEV